MCKTSLIFNITKKKDQKHKIGNIKKPVYKSTKERYQLRGENQNGKCDLLEQLICENRYYCK